jgi:glucose-6-phosphate isomerase
MKNILHFNTSPIYETFENIKKEQKDIGYYNLPDRDITHILNYASTKDVDSVTVVGIGGSNLGASMVYNFLKSSTKNCKQMFFLESTDPVKLNSRLAKIDIKKNIFVVISKSGTTLETIAIFKYIIQKVGMHRDKFLIITDSGSKLDMFATQNNIDKFIIEPNIGGRFSVLSAVGLVPLALAGIDIKGVLEGAKKIKDNFFDKQQIYRNLIHKASYYSKNKDIYNINILFSYSEYLRGFNSWYAQLWGESLGKKNIDQQRVSITPIGLIGPTDQHSFLQLIVDGKRNKTVTFVKIKNFTDDTKVPNVKLAHLESMSFLDNIDFSTLINLQADATIEQLLNQKNIPIDTIELETIDAKSMGELIYYYQLLTSLTASLMDINAYDQPGVEEGKALLKYKLQEIQDAKQ